MEITLLWIISEDISQEVIFDLRLEWWGSQSCENFREKHFRLKKQQILNLGTEIKLEYSKNRNNVYMAGAEHSNCNMKGGLSWAMLDFPP